MRDVKIIRSEPRVTVGPLNDSGDEYLDWRHVTGLIRRHWVAVAAMVALAVGIGVAYIAVTPSTYEDTATVLVEKEQSTLPAVVTHDATDQGVVSTEMEMLRSERLARQVVGDLALNVSVAGARVPRSALFSAVAATDSTASGSISFDHADSAHVVARNEVTGVNSGPIAANQSTTFGPLTFTLTPAAVHAGRFTVNVTTPGAAAAALDAAVKVGRGDRDANVIWVRYRSMDQDLASAVPRSLVQHYVTHRVAAAKAKAQAAVAFLQNQADTLQRQLTAADQQLRDFRQQSGVVSLAAEASSAVTSEAQLRLTRGTIEAERSALQHLVATADTSPSAYRGITAFPTLIANPTVSNELRTVSDLEGRRTELLLRRTPTDPDVQAIDRQIADADRQLRSLTRTYLVGLGNQVGALDKSIAAQTQSAASLPAKNMTEDQLSRRPKVLDDVYSLVETRLQEARIAESIADPGVSIIDASTATGIPVWPRKGLILVVAVAGGALAGLAVGWLREGMDGSVHSRADITRAVEGPVLTVVPHIADGSMIAVLDSHSTRARALAALPAAAPAWRRRKATQASIAEGALQEAYTWLETSLAFSQDDDVRIVAVTSPCAREGKTLNACNLALSAARHGRRVLLVDADLRRGHVNDLFRVAASPGVTDVLTGPVSLQQALHRIPVSGTGLLDVLPRGCATAHPAALLKTQAFRSLITGLQPDYDLVIIDSPPVNLVSDPLMIATLADGVLLVARAGLTDAAALSQAADHLRSAGATLLGVVLNDINLQRDGSYDDSYRYLDQAGAYASANS